MFFGINKNGQKVHIDNIDPNEEYTCPCCGGKLIPKRGDIKVHHFAHKSAICDKWYTENKGEWHVNMQNLFPKEYQEVRLYDRNDSTRWHIADVCIPGERRNYIFEFQHSPMTPDVFDERNQFYVYDAAKEENGQVVPNVILWVFDYQDEIMIMRDQNKIPYNVIDFEEFDLKEDIRWLNIKWNHAKRTLLHYDPEDPNIRVAMNVVAHEWFDRYEQDDVLMGVKMQWYETTGKVKDRIQVEFPNTGAYAAHIRSTFRTGHTSKPFLVIPHYSFKDWRYFGGKTMEVEDLRQWASKYSKEEE